MRRAAGVLVAAILGGCGGADPREAPRRPAAGELEAAVAAPARLRDDLRARHGPTLRAGRDVRVTLRPGPQRTAVRALRRHQGSAVALDVRTGDVVAWAPGGRGGDPGRTLVRPGSTYKTLQAAAALEAGTIDESTLLDGDGDATGTRNFRFQRLGPIDVAEALVRSSNTAFVDLRARVGDARMAAAARRVGYFTRPPVPDLPPTALTVSGRPFDARDVDITQVSTTLQLALLAASFADGTLPRARLTDAHPPVGRRRAWRPATARIVREALAETVRRGTAISLRHLEPPVAAKTGTMPRDDGTVQASMVALVPAQRPRWALAVSVRAPAHAVGDTGAGPAAAALAEALLDEPATGASTR